MVLGKRVRAPSSAVVPSKRPKYRKRAPIWTRQFNSIPRPTMVPFQRNGFLGDSVRVFHKYAVNLTSTLPALGGGVERIFRANGMYDPEVSVGGHQPMRFDEMSNFYNHFTVLSSTMSVIILNTSGVRVGCTLSVLPDNTHGATTMEDALEWPGTTFAYLQPETAGSANHTMTTLKKKCDVARFFGKSRSSLIDSVPYRGSAAADPSEQVYFGIKFAEDFGNSSGQGGGVVNYQVIITYEAIWTEVKRVTGS